MLIKHLLIGLTLSLPLDSGVSVAADFMKGANTAQSGDYKTAIAEWTPLVIEGNVDTLYSLALMHCSGKDVPKGEKTKF